MKSSIPVIEVLFSSQQKFLKIDATEHEHLISNTEISQQIKAIKAKHPHLTNNDLFQNPLIQFQSLTPEQISEYNSELDKFYLEYSKTLDEINQFRKKYSLTFDISLIINNSGSSPAQDIDLHLHFPDGFELIETSQKEKGPELPSPPYKPKNRFDYGSSTLMNVASIFNSPMTETPINLNRPVINKTNSYNVDFHRDNLKHGYSEHLEQLTIIYEKKSDIHNFQIDFTLSAGNVPNILEGNLNLIFQK